VAVQATTVAGGWTSSRRSVGRMKNVVIPSGIYTFLGKWGKVTHTLILLANVISITIWLLRSFFF
jgi:hypothetical protein